MSTRIVLKRPPLADYQRAILESPSRFTICEASTKSGKTHSHLWWGIEQWHRKDCPTTWEVWWVAPVYQQTKIAYSRLKANFSHVPGYTFNDSDLAARCPSGRVFRFKSAEKPDNLFGENVQAFIFDEFTRARPEAWPALRSTVTFTGGKGKMIGNFIGNANWGHQLMEAHKDDPDFAYFRINALQAVEAGILPAEEVEQARRSLPFNVFQALYMAEGSAHPLQLIRSDAIVSLWTNAHVPAGEPRMAVDVARFGRDRTVITVAHGLQVLHVETHDQTDIPEVARLVTQAATRFAIPRHAIVVDEGGVGGGVVDLLPGCIPFNGGAAQIKVKGDLNYGNLRAQCWYRAADIINSGGMWVKADDHRDSLAMELEVVRRAEDMAEGKLKVIKKDDMKSLLGRSPDIGDTLMMLMVFELKAPTSTFEDAIAGHAKAEQERRFKEFTHAHFPVTGVDRDTDGY
jgi:hypothetical protein